MPPKFIFSRHTFRTHLLFIYFWDKFGYIKKSHKNARKIVCGGQEVEVLTEKDEQKTEGIERLLKNRMKKEYLGVIVYITSVEELIVHKATMMRDKDLLDLKLLLNNKINLKTLKEMSKGRISYDKLICVLRERV